MAVRWCAAWLVVKFPLSYERTPLVYHLKLVIGEMHHTKEQILDRFCSNSACHIRCALERVEVPYRPSGRRQGEARHVELCLRWPWLRFAWAAERLRLAAGINVQHIPFLGGLHRSN